MRRNALLALMICACLVPCSRAGDWPSFRGPNGDGVSPEKHVPLRWGPTENIKWKMPLPAPGNSSPIVSKGRVFLTCATDHGKNRGLYCYDRKTGALLWSQIVPYAEPDPTHDTNPYCGSSPAADGERVVVWHGSAGLFFSYSDGKPLSSRDLGVFSHNYGHCPSPLLNMYNIIPNSRP